MKLKGGKQKMNKKIALVTLALFGSLMLSISPVFAHVHPLVPANECGLGDGAGNTAKPQNGENGQDFIGTGFIPGVNPGKANVGLLGPGVGPATSNCANA